MLERHFLLNFLCSKIYYLFIATLIFLSCDKKNHLKKDINVIALVLERKNDVKRRIHQEIEWNTIDINEELFQKDFIRTMNNSDAVIRFKDDSTLRVAENSLVVIERPEEIIEKVNTKIILEEGTLDRVFSSDNNSETISEIKTDRLITYISSQRGKVGINYKKNKKLKIAVYSGETKISTLVNKEESLDQEEKAKGDNREENTNDLLEVAVYDGEADISLTTVEGDTKKSKTKKVKLSKNEIIQVDHENRSKTSAPLKNSANIDIIKEDFVPIAVKNKIEEKIDKKPNQKIPQTIKYSKSIKQEALIKWKKVDGAEKYLIDFSKSKYFRSIIDTRFTTANELDLEIDKLEEGLYYWQVAPIINGNIKEYLKPQKFEITN